jgi:serine/threonine-protein kinase
VIPATHASETLSPELAAAAARRLGALALAVAAVSGTVGVLFILWEDGVVLGAGVRLAVTASDVLLSVGLYGLIATRRVTARRALQLGFAYEIAHGFLASVTFHAVALASGGAVRGWSAAAAWVMLYPLIVPVRPRLVWLPTLATAAMDPLAVWVNVAAGAHAPEPSDLARTFFATALACVLAPIASRIVYGLTVDVKRAEEMGSYRLVDKLGQGGMGEVWRAEHRMLARSAAIKLIRPPALGSEASQVRDRVKRFAREAQATAALRSPHTIAVYDCGVSADGTFHYVIELLEGFSQQTLIERFGPVAPERAVHLLRQACHSFAEAHATGLVHRDVMPANLFVCRLGLDVDFVKVLDFGLVKLQGPLAPDTEALTVDGAFTGTPGFVPPEVALGREPTDSRADLYALGSVASWLLTGRLVFDGPTPLQKIMDHCRTPPPPLSRRTDHSIPDALERIVLRCLKKNPRERPASAGDLSAELQTLGIEERWSEERAREWWRLHDAAPRTEGIVTGPTRERLWDETRTRVDHGEALPLRRTVVAQGPPGGER